MQSEKDACIKRFKSIDIISDTQEKVREFKNALKPLIGTKENTKPDVDSLKTFIDFIAQNTITKDPNAAKLILRYFGVTLEDVSEDYNDELLEIVLHVQNKLGKHVTEFPNSIVRIIRLLADCYQADEDWCNAAKTLASININDKAIASEMKICDRFDWIITMSELYLAMDDYLSAKIALQKGETIKNELPNPDPQTQQLLLRYTLCSARSLDASLEFLEAAKVYMKLSQTDEAFMSDNDKQQALKNAISSVVLAKPSSERSIVLATLYNDQRSKKSVEFGILEKVYKNMIISPSEIKSIVFFDHTKIKLSNGLSVAENSMAQHNIVAISKIYDNITLKKLSQLLGIGNKQIEELVKKMVQEKSVIATMRIDQARSVVNFKDIHKFCCDDDHEKESKMLLEIVSVDLNEFKNSVNNLLNDKVNTTVESNGKYFEQVCQTFKLRQNLAKNICKINAKCQKQKRETSLAIAEIDKSIQLLLNKKSKFTQYMDTIEKTTDKCQNESNLYQKIGIKQEKLLKSNTFEHNLNEFEKNWSSWHCDQLLIWFKLMLALNNNYNYNTNCSNNVIDQEIKVDVRDDVVVATGRRQNDAKPSDESNDNCVESDEKGVDVPKMIDIAIGIDWQFISSNLKRREWDGNHLLVCNEKELIKLGFEHDKKRNSLLFNVKRIIDKYPSTDKKEGLCCICLSQKTSTICIPCGHACMCKQCSNKYKIGDNCPICRKRIQNMFDFFIS